MSAQDVHVRAAHRHDDEAIIAILLPVLQAGETYALPRDMSGEAALAWWRGASHTVFVAEREGGVVGTYYLRANQTGGGAHVANCGYVVAGAAQGSGVARAMCRHSLAEASARGYLAMQFNLVVATNVRAVKLWQSCGFKNVGVIPAGFQHPVEGFVDGLVMHRLLGEAAR